VLGAIFSLRSPIDVRKDDQGGRRALAPKFRRFFLADVKHLCVLPFVASRKLGARESARKHSDGLCGRNPSFASIKQILTAE
jgi:hypothetical protein